MADPRGGIRRALAAFLEALTGVGGARRPGVERSDRAVTAWSDDLSRRVVRVVVLVALAVASPAGAGPPFLTDDPEPVEPGHWEAYAFSTLDASRDARTADAPAFELNFGPAPDLQLHIVVPFTSVSPSRGAAASGLGDVEIGVKVRLVEESDRRPQVGVFPMLELPTGDAGRGLGNGRLWARLPVWVQKSRGPWTTYGGGGWAVNRAPGARDYLFAGWLLQRRLGKRLTFGGEAFARAADTVGGRGASIVDAGGTVDLRPGFSVLFSAGHTVAGERHAVAYLGLYWTWGGASGRPAAARAPHSD